MRETWTLLAAGLTVLCSCQPQQTSAPDLDESEIAALQATDDRALEALGAGDWSTYRSLVTEDVRWMVPEGQSLLGWPALEEFVGQFERVNGLTHSNRQLRGSGNLAYRTLDYVMRADVVGGESELVYSGKLITVYRRTADGSWRIEAEMWNASPGQ